MEYEAVIGLEVHVQLSTQSKIFCSTSTTFGAKPNLHIDPLTFGLPGALPVVNKKVIEHAILLGLALNCEIRPFTRFARKHYFYPDLPKGYQISQYEEPICERGHVNIHLDDYVRTVGITRVHMEEDAGKNIHDARLNASLIDLNRAGVPLLEIVTEPDLRSPGEVSAFLKTLRQIVRYLYISDGNMEEGSLRCDVNISLRPQGEMKYGTRTEIKNVNSFKFIEHALEYEIARQMAILKKGRAIEQETRLFDPESGTTNPMRGKEESSDYRYFPDPDLPPIVISNSWIENIKDQLPKLPEDYFTELVEKLGLSSYDAGVLTAEKAYLDYFMEVYAFCNNAKTACNWITSELFGLLKRDAIDFSDTPVSATDLGNLIKLIDNGTISGKMAKSVFEEMYTSGKSPEKIVKERGLKQITSDDEILRFVCEAFDANPKQLADYLAGKEKVHGFFVGAIMKASNGSANPQKVNELIKAELARRKEEQ